MRCLLSALLLPALWALAGAAQADPAALAARFPPPAQRPDTPAFAPGRSDFTRPAELSAWLERLAARPGVHRLEAGRSQRGAPIEALHFSRGPGRPAVLLVGQQHGDEPAGAEALLVVAHQLAGGALAPLLEQVDVVLLPRANPDGAATGQRHAADGSDPNRDHLLLATPEARAIAGLLRRFDPLLVADLHEYDPVARWEEHFGAVPSADLLLQAGTPPPLAPELAQAAEEGFLRPLRDALDARGLRHDWYHTASPVPGDLRVAMGSPQPDTLRNVQALRLGVGVLLESRGQGRAHLARRVDALAVASANLLKSAAERAGELAALRRTLARRTSDAACNGQLTVLAGQTHETRELRLLDPQTGDDRVLPVLWLSSLALRPLVERPRPCAYWLAASATEAAERLRLLGLQLQPLAVPQLADGEVWRETGRLTSGRLRQVLAVPEAERLRLPAGSVVVPLAQPLAALASAALEPDAPGSYYAARLLPELGDAARVLAPLAARAESASAPARAASEQ